MRAPWGNRYSLKRECKCECEREYVQCFLCLHMDFIVMNALKINGNAVLGRVVNFVNIIKRPIDLLKKK